MITSLILITALNPLNFNNNNTSCMTYEIRHTQTIFVDDNYNSIEATLRFSYNLYNGTYNSADDFVRSWNDNGEGFITNGILFSKLARVDVDYYYNNAQGVPTGKKTTKLASIQMTYVGTADAPVNYWMTNSTYSTTSDYTNYARTLRFKSTIITRPSGSNVVGQISTQIASMTRGNSYQTIYDSTSSSLTLSPGSGDLGPVYTNGVYDLTPTYSDMHERLIDIQVRKEALSISRYRSLVMEDIGSTLDAKYNLGYQDGLRAAELSNDISSPFDLIGTAFSGVANILSIKIGPVSLGLLLSLPLVALVVGAVIKIIGG